MSLASLFKLEKLTIEAYSNVKRSKKVRGMELMFNPTSFQETHANSYGAQGTKPINAPGVQAGYRYTPPSGLSLDLVLDGTGVNRLGAASLLAPKSVRAQIADFKKVCLEVNGEIHQPNFLKVRWGNFKFSCRLATLDIAYELFDEAGDPLRAKLHVSFVKDQSAESILLEAGMSSPDLTHVRTVKSGDTLPLLCKEIYGSPVHYLRVAADNGLDDFRNLVPGQTLRFAPLK